MEMNSLDANTLSCGVYSVACCRVVHGYSILIDHAMESISDAFWIKNYVRWKEES
ncbi:MAG: hypothetical protein J6P99_00555 [Paludibacteraceae bacterium]|nr:hypothetical protein [Paludibacteraceae bacterium]